MSVNAIASRVLVEIVSQDAATTIDGVAVLGRPGGGGGTGRTDEVTIAISGRGSRGAGTVTGTVTDTRGGVLPGATVQVMRDGVRVADATTDASGHFRIASVPSGEYQINFGLTGFRTASRSSVDVPGGIETVLNATLQVSAAAESVAVAAPATAPRAPVVGLGGGSDRAPLRSVASSAPPTRWRVLASGRAERSINGGLSWEGVDIDSPVALTGGVAPSRWVCWLIGPSGVILRTTDGMRFERVRFPETTNLSSISATDARNATVTTADGRTFTTTDGGQTWHSSSNSEF